MPGKRLEITYDGKVLCSADVVEFTWTESEDGISVKGSYRARPQGATLGDLISGLKQGAAPPNGTQAPVIPEA